MIRLSIIIPTKDRYVYLLPLIKLIDSYKLKECEIVIEDNSSDNSEISEFLSSHTFTTPIVYNHTPVQIAICDNIDNAINHSSGKYVCIIGDDDAVTPLILECLDFMDENGADSFRQAEEITYKWPSYADDKNVFCGGTLVYGALDDSYETVDTVGEVVKVIGNGIMSLGKMPCVYQGIVRRATLDRLNNIGGTYFPGPSPDMANAMALSFVVDKHIVGNMPVIVSGGSEYQGGRSKKIKSWVQPLENIPFISEEAKKKWDKRVPYFWCGHTVWPESGIKGLAYVDQESLLRHMDFDRLLAKCLYRGGSKFRDEVLSRATNKKKVLAGWMLFSLREYLAGYKRRMLKTMHKVSGDRMIAFGIKNISDAKDFLIDKFLHFNKA